LPTRTTPHLAKAKKTNPTATHPVSFRKQKCELKDYFVLGFYEVYSGQQFPKIFF
jgi:hypothetical protein